MRYKMTKKYHICHHHIRFFFQAQNAPKSSVFSWGSAPDPAGGAYDAPPDSLVDPLPIPLPTRRRKSLRRLELGAYGASVLRPPPPLHKILDTPVRRGARPQYS